VMEAPATAAMISIMAATATNPAYRPCPRKGFFPRRRGRERCPKPWRVVLGGPA
jgi:hypothetical protein